ncbi:hypothetical protein CMI37_29815 [Candidatus Pacearchaeota archaeon]|jgi:hypothetical protein|nr:hypothetical protein [Candidatus Pacearchaeota archaeon]|tara:strand:- start:1369 stop:2088 length:720 start_codon:yes stop_codon:yes gene_type:complete
MKQIITLLLGLFLLSGLASAATNVDAGTEYLLTEVPLCHGNIDVAVMAENTPSANEYAMMVCVHEGDDNWLCPCDGGSRDLVLTTLETTSNTYTIVVNYNIEPLENVPDTSANDTNTTTANTTLLSEIEMRNSNRIRQLTFTDIIVGGGSDTVPEEMLVFSDEETDFAMIILIGVIFLIVIGLIFLGKWMIKPSKEEYDAFGDRVRHHDKPEPTLPTGDWNVSKPPKTDDDVDDFLKRI